MFRGTTKQDPLTFAHACGGSDVGDYALATVEKREREGHALSSNIALCSGF